jgi:hypothetical protein
MTQEQLADSMAKRMVAYAAKRSQRNIHFQVILAHTLERLPTRPYCRKVYCEPSFPTMWKDFNARGVTYHRKDQTEEAAAWVKTALLAGYTVFWGTRKHGCFGGHALKDGPSIWWDIDDPQSPAGEG